VKRIFGAALSDYLPALGLLVITSLYLYLSYGYPAKARAFPAMVAWVMLALLLLDLVSRTETRLGLAVMRALNPAQARGSERAPSALRQLSAMLWIAGFTTGIVLIGILSAVPLYVFAAIRFRGERGYLTALAAAAGATLFIYLLFGVVLRLNLYPGILFTSA
jgi:hypothetical protein